MVRYNIGHVAVSIGDINLAIQVCACERTFPILIETTATRM